jgi:hypothetical protein
MKELQLEHWLAFACFDNEPAAAPFCFGGPAERLPGQPYSFDTCLSFGSFQGQDLTIQTLKSIYPGLISIESRGFSRLLGGNGSEVGTVTENVSTHALLLRCEAPIALGSKVKVTMRFPRGPSGKAFFQKVLVEKEAAYRSQTHEK